jgi:hypothetical protein
MCALAGRWREAALSVSKARTSIAKGLVFCALSGWTAALMNFGLAFRESDSGSRAKRWRAKTVELECSAFTFDVDGRCAQSRILRLPHEKK